APRRPRRGPRARARAALRLRGSSDLLELPAQRRERAREMGLDAAVGDAERRRGLRDVEAFPDAVEEYLALAQRQRAQRRVHRRARVAVGRALQRTGLARVGDLRHRVARVVIVAIGPAAQPAEPAIADRAAAVKVEQ